MLYQRDKLALIESVASEHEVTLQRRDDATGTRSLPNLDAHKRHMPESLCPDERLVALYHDSVIPMLSLVLSLHRNKKNAAFI